MNIQLIDSSTYTSNSTTYNAYNLKSDDVTAMVMIVSGKSNYVNVTVKNASHKAYRGMGKDFKDINQAVANYKSPRIKAMIKQAQDFENTQELLHIQNNLNLKRA